jgi:hypothetical protein
VVAGRADGAKGVAGAAAENEIDGVEDSAGGARRDVPGARIDVGVAGAQVGTAGSDVAAGDGEVFAGVAEEKLVVGRSARLDREKLRDERPERGDDDVEALRTLGVLASGEVVAGDGIG